MKKTIRLLGLFCLLVLSGLSVKQTTSRAGCYYPEKKFCYRQDPNSPSNQYGKYDVWMYADDLTTAIEKVADGGTIYYISTHGSKKLPAQTFINKNINIVGATDLAWDDPPTGWYSDSGYGSRNTSYHQGIKNVQAYTGDFAGGMPEVTMRGTERKYNASEKLTKKSSDYRNVFGVSLVIQGNVTISGIKFSGLCGTSNNPCSLLMVNNGADCKLQRVWVADNDWYTYQGKKAQDWSNTATEQRDGIGNPGGGITVYDGTCHASNVKVSNCHGYFSGGGIHVGKNGILKNDDNTMLEITKCTASSGGGISAVDGGKVYLWASGATVDITDNYLEKNAYQAYQQKTNIGYTAGNIHIGKDSYCRLGCSGSMYRIGGGGKETAYHYAQAGSPDAGNIICKGTLVTDQDTYLSDSEGSSAAEVYVTKTGTWKYGNNGTSTVIGRPSGEASTERVWTRYDRCGVSGALTSDSICPVVRNAGGIIQGTHDNSILNLHVNVESNRVSGPWRMIYNSDGGTLTYRGTIRERGSTAIELKSIDNNGSRATVKTTEIAESAGEVICRGEGSLLITEETNTFRAGMATGKGAQTLVSGSTLDCNGRYLANWGLVQIGTDSECPKIQNTVFHNYGDGQTYANADGQGNAYQSYYEGMTNGCLRFHNNTTTYDCRLAVYGGYVRFENKGHFDASASEPVRIRNGSLHLDGSDVSVAPHLYVDATEDPEGDYANLHISQYGSGSIPKIFAVRGRVDVDGNGSPNLIRSQGTVDIKGSGASVGTVENCGRGTVYQRNGTVKNVTNGACEDFTTANTIPTGASRSYLSHYYQSGGSVTGKVVNYATYHAGDKSCGASAQAKILAPVTNEEHGLLILGSVSPSGTGTIGTATARKNVTNKGTIRNVKGTLYVNTLNNTGEFWNQDNEDTKNVAVTLSATTIKNAGSLRSYAGQMEAVTDFSNTGRTILRGTRLKGADPVNEENGTFAVLNPLAGGEQYTDIRNTIINKGTLWLGNEKVTDRDDHVTDTIDLDINLAEHVQNHNVLNINLGDPDGQGNAHKTFVMHAEIKKEDGKYHNSYTNEKELHIGPAVKFEGKDEEDGLINQGELQFDRGNDQDVNAKGENRLVSTFSRIRNEKHMGMDATAGLKITEELRNGFQNEKAGKAILDGRLSLADNKTVTNEKDSVMELRRSGEYSGYTVNKGTLKLGSERHTFTIHCDQETKPTDTELKHSLRTLSGTTEAENASFVGINDYAVYVEESQFIIDEQNHNAVNGKKISVYLDPEKGTQQEDKVPVIDHSTRTTYQMGFHRPKVFADDNLVKNLKVPLVTITNPDKRDKWQDYVSAYTKDRKQNITFTPSYQKRYDLYMHAEQPVIPDDHTVYLYFRDITPPSIGFDGSRDKYVEVDCRYGSHTTAYLPLQISDDLSGVKTITIGLENLDSGEKIKKEITLPDPSRAFTAGEEDLLSLHNDDMPLTFGNLAIRVTASDAAGNTTSKTKTVMAGRITAEIYDKFEDSKTLSGNTKTYWNFMPDGESEDCYIENVGNWPAGDQKWMKLTLEGFWDSAKVTLENDEGIVDLSQYDQSYTVEKTSYKTINGKVNGKQTELTLPLKAKHKDLAYTGVITTKKAGKNGVRDEKTFMFTFNSSKKKSVENSIEKRILQQGTQLEDGTYTDGFNTYREK